MKCRRYTCQSYKFGDLKCRRYSVNGAMSGIWSDGDVLLEIRCRVCDMTEICYWRLNIEYMTCCWRFSVNVVYGIWRVGDVWRWYSVGDIEFWSGPVGDKISGIWREGDVLLVMTYWSWVEVEVVSMVGNTTCRRFIVGYNYDVTEVCCRRNDVGKMTV